MTHRLTSHRPRRLLSRTLDLLSDALWPPACQLCETPLTTATFSGWCAGCWRASLDVSPGPACPSCGLGRPATSPPGRCLECRRRPSRGWSVARHGGRFEGPLREAIHRYKYRGELSLARPLGRLLSHAAARLPVLPDQIDAIVTVPMDGLRRLVRGYDPTLLLGRELARALGRPLVTGVLRARRGPRQARLSREERQSNARRRFGRGRRPCPRRVVLVDDVWTTGATAQVCARLLRDAGARTVCLVTVARAV